MSALDTAKALIFTGGTIPTTGASAGDLAAEIEAVLPEAAGDGPVLPLVTSAGRALLWLYDGLLDAAGLSPALREDAVREIAPRVPDAPGMVPLFAARTDGSQHDRLIAWLDHTGFNYVGRDDQPGPDPDAPAARTVTDGRSLHRWRTKLARIGMGEAGAKAKLAVFGDSWGQTYYVPREFKAILDDEHGSGGEGWRPAISGDSLSGATYTASGWTQVDGSANSTFPYNPGPDGIVMYTSGTAATATWTNAVATEFRVLHYQYGGTLRWRVDGGAWTAVTADSSETLDVITISGLSDAAHTLEIDTTGNAGVVDLVGIYGTRSGVAGVEILKMANSGTTAFRMQAYNEFVTAPLAELQPDLALVMLGTNDYRSTVSPPSVYIAGLQGLVDAARAAVPDLGFIFVVPSQSDPDGQQIPLADYRDALFAWAEQEGHEVISWLDRWPDFATAQAGGLWRDNLHPSSLGGHMGAKDTINSLMKG